MTAIFSLINNYILSPILRGMLFIFGDNFAVTIFVFTLLVNVIMIPLTIKSQKSSVQQMRIKPKLDVLKKKYGDDKQKYNAEMQKLYQQENVSMSGGCLPMILRFVFLLSVYYLILQPITYLSGIGKDTVNAVVDFVKTQGMVAANSRSVELDVISLVRDSANFSGADAAIKSAAETINNGISNINFNFFGIDLTQTPKFSWNISQADILWVIPLLAFATAMLTSILSLVLQKKTNPDAPSMAGMMLTMPIVSLVIAFAAPCGLGFYWACSSLISGVLQAVIQYVYGPQRIIAKQRAKAIVKCYEAEGKTISAEKNENTTD